MFYRTVGEQLCRGFLAWGKGQIDSPTPEQLAREAARLLIMAEGAMLPKSIGMSVRACKVGFALKDSYPDIANRPNGCQGMQSAK